MDCEKCFHYWNNGKDEYCEKRGWDFKRTGCPDFQDKSKPKTNADRFRAMTDEELAHLLNECVCPIDECPHYYEDRNCTKAECEKCWLDWLKQEAKDD